MTAPPASVPGKAERGGYVYVVEFSNGTVKVGSTADPQTRFSNHRSGAAAFGLSVTNEWVSPWREDYLDVEKYLLIGTRIIGGTTSAREYFSEVPFLEVVAEAEDLLSPGGIERRAARIALERQALRIAAREEARQRRASQRPEGRHDRTFRLRAEFFDLRMAAIGVTSVAAQARYFGVHRSTLFRLRESWSRVGLQLAWDMAAAAGVHIEDIFEMAVAEQPAVTDESRLRPAA